MEDIINDCTKELAQKVNAEKERLIRERLFEILGYELNIIEETQRMFPRIAKKYSGIDRSETYLWNDGTITGKVIITFYPSDMEFSKYGLNASTVTAGFKYK